jgi:hypothetical protein
MTWIRTIPSSEANDALWRGIEAQAARALATTHF